MVNICKIFGQYLQDIRPPIKILCWYCLTCYTLIIQCLFQVYKLPKNSSSWSWIQQSWVDKGKSEEEDTVSHISTVTFRVISIKWPRTNKFWMNWVWDNRKLPMTTISSRAVILDKLPKDKLGEKRMKFSSWWSCWPPPDHCCPSQTNTASATSSSCNGPFIFAWTFSLCKRWGLGNGTQVLPTIMQVVVP